VGPTLGPGIACVTEPVNSTRSRAFSWIHGSSSSTSTSTISSFCLDWLLGLVLLEEDFDDAEDKNKSGFFEWSFGKKNGWDWKGILERFLVGRGWKCEVREEEVKAIGGKWNEEERMWRLILFSTFFGGLCDVMQPQAEGLLFLCD